MSTVKVLNLASLNDKLTKLSRLDIEKVINKACLIVERDAKKNCPVDTGELRNSIKSQVHTEGTTVIGEVGTNLEYAPYVEFGTGLFAAEGNGRQTPWSYKTADGEWHTTIGQHPQPYLQPALNDNEDNIKNLINNELKSEVRNSVRS